MREVARWFAEAVSIVEGCGEPEGELLLQRGITSLEDLAECQAELLASLPGIDEAGAEAIKARAAELAVEKAEEEAAVAEAAAAEAAAAEAAAAEAAAAETETAEAAAAETETAEPVPADSSTPDPERS
jgi:chemosensory pili system protein ChpA (sensor histidine kinase/response regulator)